MQSAAFPEDRLDQVQRDKPGRDMIRRHRELEIAADHSGRIVLGNLNSHSWCVLILDASFGNPMCGYSQKIEYFDSKVDDSVNSKISPWMPVVSATDCFGSV